MSLLMIVKHTHTHENNNCVVLSQYKVDQIVRCDGLFIIASIFCDSHEQTLNFLSFCCWFFNRWICLSIYSERHLSNWWRTRLMTNTSMVKLKQQTKHIHSLWSEEWTLERSTHTPLTSTHNPRKSRFRSHMAVKCTSKLKVVGTTTYPSICRAIFGETIFHGSSRIRCDR